MNERLRQYAERYLSIYRQFENALAAEGLEFAEDRSERLIALKAECITSGVLARNSCKSYLLNNFSKACEDCCKGYSSSTFILTLDCNRDCFFCSNRNQENYKESLGKVFDIGGEYENYIKNGMKFTSVAVTGGEPLMHPDMCISFYKKVKKTDKRTHTRLYTNGDLLDERYLKELGRYLDEIRISAKDEDGIYDLAGLKEKLDLSKRYVKDVTVEMPVLPDSFDEMAALLNMLEKVGVFSINLLEFLFPWQNVENYKELGYKIKNRPYRVLYKYNYAGGLPVDGSEETALQIIKYAAERSFKLGVHYCSLENKLTSQIYQQNVLTKLSPLEVMDNEDFFIKTAKTFGEDAFKVRNVLDENNIYYYTFDESKESIEFRTNDIRLLKGSDVGEIGISYFVTESNGINKFLREINFEIINIQEVANEYI
ncbi:radical SAM protein [Deferribacteres bacterium DY0037]